MSEERRTMWLNKPDLERNQKIRAFSFVDVSDPDD
jgi:hypothetical protein